MDYDHKDYPCTEKLGIYDSKYIWDANPGTQKLGNLLILALKMLNHNYRIYHRLCKRVYEFEMIQQLFLDQNRL